MFLAGVFQGAKAFADDDNFGGGDFETHEAMVGVQAEDDFEVGGGHFEAFVGFAIRADGAGPIHGGGAGQEFLGNEDGELCAPRRDQS